MNFKNWLSLLEERDTEANLTPLALALDAISNNGCDCGVDEPGTCLACACEAGLRDLWERLQAVTALATPPKVYWKLAQADKLEALVPGMCIVAHLQNDGSSRVLFFDTTPEQKLVSAITVHLPPGIDNAASEAIEVASGLYWAWWRACMLRGTKLPEVAAPATVFAIAEPGECASFAPPNSNCP